MKSYTVTTHIDAPQDVVFDLVADLPNAPQRITGIKNVEVLTDGPIGAGTRWRETREIMKREATEEMEISKFDRPNGYTVVGDSCGAHFETDIRMRPEQSGTLLEMEMRTQPVTFMAKIMSPIMGAMMSKMMLKCMQDDLNDIKVAAESQAQPAAT